MTSARLAGKTVIVTGAAHGIGAAIATCVADAGAYVALADLEPIGPKAVAALARSGAGASSHILDVRDVTGWRHLVAEVTTARGRIDGLVNNAGVNVKHEPLTMPEGEWDRCLDVNLRGAWNGAREVLPIMTAAGRGAIVNIASVHGHAIVPGSFPYPVAKHGLIGLTRALGVEYAPQGVRVNAISPGYIDTRLCREWWAADADPTAARLATEALIPARRIGRADEVGMTVVFLLSDEAPYICASTIEVDGGRLAVFHQ